MELGLAGKTVIVTGGASNIGRSISLAFSREGCNVAIVDLDAPQAEKVVGEMAAWGAKGAFIKTDVTDWQQVQRMVPEVIQRFGTIDILVNNVGWSPFGFFTDSGPEMWEKTIKLNFLSMLLCTKAVLNHMIERRTGDIINLGSTSSHGMKTQAVYGACKAAVESFSYALAREVGRWGIRVNVVIPPLPTEPVSPDHAGQLSIHAPGGYGPASWGNIPKEQQEAIKRRRHPMGEVMTPDDIAMLVVLVASSPLRKFTAQAFGEMGGVEFG